MWIIWKEEFRKIVSRKIIWFAVVLLFGFVTLRLFTEVKSYKVTVEGKTYQGQRAIRKDQELTRKYAGELTEEKIKLIQEKYGFYPYIEDDESAERNFLSQFITDRFTNYRTTFGYVGEEDIHFYEGEDWRCNVAPYLENKAEFDYIYGWSDFVEMYMLVLMVLYVILIVSLSPVFSEEYMLKTGDIIRTTKRGKSSGIWMKILAACVFAALLTVMVSFCLFGIYLMVYGMQGLDASAVFLSLATFYGYCPKSVGGFLILMAVLAVFGALLLTGITLGYSSACRNSFLALILSVIVFLIPLFWIKVLLPMCQGFLKAVVVKAVSHFMTSMPVYLPMSTGFAFSGEQIIMHLVIAVIVGAFGMGYGYFQYRSCRK